MPSSSHRALRVLLGFLSLLMVIAGVLLIFSSKAVILRLFLRPPDVEISTLLLATLKEMGGLALMLGIMFFFRLPRPRAQRRDYLCARHRSLHTRRDTAHFSLYARRR
jgi:uncharacterized BrkB/YihY/UPF0761 family membrane protein